MSGDTSAPEVLNKDGDAIELDSMKNEVVRASIDGKTSFMKVQPFAKALPEATRAAVIASTFIVENIFLFSILHFIGLMLRRVRVLF